MPAQPLLPLRSAPDVTRSAVIPFGYLHQDAIDTPRAPERPLRCGSCDGSGRSASPIIGKDSAHRVIAHPVVKQKRHSIAGAIPEALTQPNTFVITQELEPIFRIRKWKRRHRLSAILSFGNQVQPE